MGACPGKNESDHKLKATWRSRCRPECRWSPPARYGWSGRSALPFGCLCRFSDRPEENACRHLQPVDRTGQKKDSEALLIQLNALESPNAGKIQESVQYLPGDRCPGRSFHAAPHHPDGDPYPGRHQLSGGREKRSRKTGRRIAEVSVHNQPVGVGVFVR